jgi:mono/diheme cytochrome c family protein
MRKAFRIIGKILLGLVALILLVVVAGYVVSAIRFKHRYAIAPTRLVVPADSASLARGEALAALSGCTGCHSATLGGQVMFSAFPFARVAAPNLTRGRGGVGASYTDADWEHAIRHGVRRNGEHLVIMPADEFNQLRDQDVAQLIAYVKSVPPVDSVVPRATLWPMGRVLHAFGAPLAAAEHIDHTRQRVVAPPPGPTVEYGKFLARGCMFCHGPNLKGQATGGEPGSPPAPDISNTGNPGKWTEAEFVHTLRTGVTPTGRRLVAQYMPWPAIGKLPDEELRGLYLYLQVADSVRMADSVAAAKK